MDKSQIKMDGRYWSDDAAATFHVVSLDGQKVKFIRVDEDGGHTGGESSLSRFAAMMDSERETERWELASWDDVPDRFSDPRCDEFRVFCSGGFEGGLELGSAFKHKPRHFPQCFPSGQDGHAVCTRVLLRRLKD